MKYFLGLVNRETGAIDGRLDVPIHAHSNATRVLTKNEQGVGKSGDVVRVPSVLENENATDDDVQGFSLALCADRVNDDGETESVVYRLLDAKADAQLMQDIIQGYQSADRALADQRNRVAQLTSDIATLRGRLDAAEQQLKTLMAPIAPKG